MLRGLQKADERIDHVLYAKFSLRSVRCMTKLNKGYKNTDKTHKAHTYYSVF